MANLFTKHDTPFHTHAVCGFMCLLHFLYRYIRLCVCGQAFTEHASNSHLSFPSWELGMDTVLVAMHACLHVTSFRFNLPSKRNFNKPMIWPEFRMHSAVFAIRHVMCTITHWWFPTWWSKYGCNVLIVLFANELASKITSMCGDSSGKMRTTNTMPYPLTATPTNVRNTKSFYVAAQMGATSCAIWGPPTVAFLPLCAIELSPFMMTLVRKGKVNALWYHRVYALALLLNYPTWATAVWQTWSTTSDLTWVISYIITMRTASFLRFGLLRHRRAAWSWLLAVGISCVLTWTVLYGSGLDRKGALTSMDLPTWVIYIAQLYMAQSVCYIMGVGGSLCWMV